MKNNFHIEICANSVESCIQAEKGGASRVELCASIPEGGTTPSLGMIKIARKLIDIDLNVIIRPRGGDFLYSDIEHKIMLQDIKAIRKMGVNGIVIGSLTANGDIDMIKNRELIEASEGMSVTFHRAFDMCRNPFESLENIIELGCNRLLTSGQKSKAIEGVGLIQKLIEQASNKIIIMPGSGINQNNIKEIAKKTGAKEFHLSARKPQKSKMIFRNPKINMGGTCITINEYQQDTTSADEVARTRKYLLE